MAGEAPVHEHDCERCTFLGTYHYDKKEHDLYCCVGAGWTSIVARDGDDGPSYSSFPADSSWFYQGYPENLPLMVAFRRSVAEGLVALGELCQDCYEVHQKGDKCPWARTLV